MEESTVQEFLTCEASIGRLPRLPAHRRAPRRAQRYATIGISPPFSPSPARLTPKQQKQVIQKKKSRALRGGGGGWDKALK